MGEWENGRVGEWEIVGSQNLGGALESILKLMWGRGIRPRPNT